MRKLEKEGEKEFVSYVHKCGCRAFKLSWIKKGWPDQLVLMPHARVAFFEFKRFIDGRTTKQSPHQDELQEKITALGFDWHTPASFEQAKEILDAYLDPAKISKNSN